MSTNHNTSIARTGVLAIVVLALVAVLYVAPPGAGTAAAADPRLAVDPREAPPAHFLSGSERSLAVLQSMDATLARIDARLERIEALLAKPPAAGQAQPNTLPMPGGAPW